jgi:ankyrin repeat protein
VLTELVQAGAHINAKNQDGNTPLILAAKISTPEVITTLLQLGADLKIKNNSGKIALDYAKENYRLRNTDAFWKLNDASY